MMMGRPSAAPGPHEPEIAENDPARRATIDQPDPHDRRDRKPVSGRIRRRAGEYPGQLHGRSPGREVPRIGASCWPPIRRWPRNSRRAWPGSIRPSSGRPAGDKPAMLGDFQVLRELGRGGMGVVYEAEQTSLRRRVALKVLRFGAVADEEAMRRFRREAETRRPAAPHQHRADLRRRLRAGRALLRHAVHRRPEPRRRSGRITANGEAAAAEDVAGWGRQAAEALAHAHQRGVIHRDVKPSNLLLDPEGVVWLTDFGLAKRADEVTLTVSGALMGTPRYMSPEQAESLQRPVDHRTDLYSLGATLYELATGRPVFESATPHGVIAQILNEEPARPRQVRPGLPRDLETIILTCLAKDPSQRYQTAHALADDLRAVLDGRPIRARASASS